MGAQPDSAIPVGRDQELALLGAVVDRARNGEASGLLLSGDAGVGKTVLARSVCEPARGDVVSAQGSCLPLQSIAPAMLPIREGCAPRQRRPR